jgi:MFS family permease
MQVIRGFSALDTGLRYLPLTGMIFFVAPIAGRIAQRHGSRWPMTIGPVLAGVGLLLLSRSGVDTSYGVMAPVLSLMGIGMGMTMAPMTSAVMSAVGPQRAGLGSAMSNASRQLGGVFGVALLGTLLTTQLRESLTSSISGLGIRESQYSAILTSAGHGRLDPAALRDLSPDQSSVVQEAFRMSFLSGFRLALVVGAGFAIVAGIVANRFIPSGAPGEDHAMPTRSQSDVGAAR